MEVHWRGNKKDPSSYCELFQYQWKQQSALMLQKMRKVSWLTGWLPIVLLLGIAKFDFPEWNWKLHMHKDWRHLQGSTSSLAQ